MKKLVPGLSLLFLCGLLTWPIVGTAQSWVDRLKGAAPQMSPAAESTSVTAPTTGSVMTEHDTLVAGLREALNQGAIYAVESAGKTGGFLENPRIRIPMPGYLNDAGTLIRGVGLGRYVDEFENSMNRAAEQAVAASAAPILADAISQMSIEDAREILVGAPDSATRYLRRTTSDSLKGEVQPVVAEAMRTTGATNAYSQLSEQIAVRVPGIEPDSALDLESYVTGKTLDGLFSLIALEEQRIRSDPLARGTELLQQVFGQ